MVKSGRLILIFSNLKKAFISPKEKFQYGYSFSTS